MKKRVVVLGGGRIGSAIAADLNRGGAWEVTVADTQPEVLARVQAASGVAIVKADLSDPAALTHLVAGYDLVGRIVDVA